MSDKISFSIYNDYNGGYFVGYDNARDAVLIVPTGSPLIVNWKIIPFVATDIPAFVPTDGSYYIKSHNSGKYLYRTGNDSWGMALYDVQTTRDNNGKWQIKTYNNNTNVVQIKDPNSNRCMFESKRDITDFQRGLFKCPPLNEYMSDLGWTINPVAGQPGKYQIQNTYTSKVLFSNADGRFGLDVSTPAFNDQWWIIVQ